MPSSRIGARYFNTRSIFLNPFIHNSLSFSLSSTFTLVFEFVESSSSNLFQRTFIFGTSLRKRQREIDPETFSWPIQSSAVKRRFDVSAILSYRRPARKASLLLFSIINLEARAKARSNISRWFGAASKCAPGQANGNRFRGSFRRRKSKQTRLNLAGKAGGANKKRRTADDSSYALSLPPNRVFVSICSRVHLSSITTPPLFSLFSSNNTSGRNNGLSGFGKGRDAAAGIVPPFYQRNYFYAPLSNPPHRTHFNISRWPGPSSPIPLLSSFPRPYSISKITKQFLPDTRNFKPRRITCFHSSQTFWFADPARAVLLLPSPLFLCNAIVLVRPATRGREILFRDISTTSRAFDVTGDACRPFVKRSNALLAP